MYVKNKIQSKCIHYLGPDSDQEAPHGFVRCVVFTPTPHLKGEGHSVSIHL